MRANDMSKLVRPWWRGRDGDHVKADCPLLAADGGAAEGSGWFNLDDAGDPLCPHCFAWNANCDGCGASMAAEEGGPQDEAAAKTWMNEHFCIPRFTLTPTIRPAAPAPRIDGQAALFAVEATR